MPTVMIMVFVLNYGDGTHDSDPQLINTNCTAVTSQRDSTDQVSLMRVGRADFRVLLLVLVRS